MMTWIILGVVAVVYLIGTFTVNKLDEIFYDGQDPVQHYIILFIMWLSTPILLIVFIFQYLKKLFRL